MRCSYRTLRRVNQGHDTTTQERGSEPRRRTEPEHSGPPYCRHSCPWPYGMADVIGPKLKARNFENQTAEVKIGVRILNRMTELGRPKFERTA